MTSQIGANVDNLWAHCHPGQIILRDAILVVTSATIVIRSAVLSTMFFWRSGQAVHSAIYAPDLHGLREEHCDETLAG